MTLRGNSKVLAYKKKMVSGRSIHAPFAQFSTPSLEEEEAYKAFNHKHIQHNGNLLSPKMTFEVIVHGLVLWASLGFLTPIGTLIIRMSNREERRPKARIYFYVHLVIQMLSLVLATTGAIMSIKTFENSFNNHHQRIGLALYGAIWVQAILGFFRPKRGSKKRSIWYFLHWIYGTMICIVGILNVYTGLEAYKKRTQRSVTLWTAVFTAQICILAFFYLLQEKWDYMKKQGVISAGEDIGQIKPSDQESSDNQSVNNGKDLWRQPCSKTNALKNLFK